MRIFYEVLSYLYILIGILTLVFACLWTRRAGPGLLISFLVVSLVMMLVFRVNSNLHYREWIAICGSLIGQLGSFFLLAFVIVARTGTALLFRDAISGKSPGKAMTGLQVVDASTGRPIGVGQSCARNWPFLIPVMPLVELIVANLREDKRRLGDLLANTD
jgi:uncharacterized RDD family membrane protein YckC